MTSPKSVGDSSTRPVTPEPELYTPREPNSSYEGPVLQVMAASLLSPQAPPRPEALPREFASTQAAPKTSAQLAADIKTKQASHDALWWWNDRGGVKRAKLQKEITELTTQHNEIKRIEQIEIGAIDPDTEKLIQSKQTIDSEITKVKTSLDKPEPFTEALSRDQQTLANVLGEPAVRNIVALQNSEAKLKELQEQLVELDKRIQTHLELKKDQHAKLEITWLQRTPEQELAFLNTIEANFKNDTTLTYLKNKQGVVADIKSKYEQLAARQQRLHEVDFNNLTTPPQREAFLQALDEHIKALSSLNDPQLKQEIDRLRKLHTDIKTKVVDFDKEYYKYDNIRKNYQILKAQHTHLQQVIDDVEKNRNLVKRRVLIAETRGLANKKRELVAEKKRLETQRTNIHAVDTNPIEGTGGFDNLPTARTDRFTEITARLEELGDSKNKSGHLHDVDILFKSALAKLREFDQPPYKPLPGEGWGSVFWEGIKKAIGTTAFSPRDDGRNSINDLVMEKLMADQGVTMTDCYNELLKTVGVMKDWPAWQAKLTEMLTGLPAWANDNPQAAHDLYVNLAHMRAVIRNSRESGFGGMMDNMLQSIRAKSMAETILGPTENAVYDKGTSPEMFALMHIASLTPVAAHIVNDQDSRLGLILRGAGGGVIAQLFGDVITSAAKTTVEQHGLWLPPHATTDVIDAINSLYAGQTLQEVAQDYAAKAALRTVTSELRNIKNEGIGKWLLKTVTLQTAFKTLKHASNVERVVRGMTEYVVPAAFAALCVLGGPLGMAIGLVGFLASSFLIGRINNFIFSATHYKVQQEELAAHLKTQILSNDNYKTYLARVGGDEKSQTALAAGAAEKLVQKTEELKKKGIGPTTIIEALEKELDTDIAARATGGIDSKGNPVSAEAQRAITDVLFDPAISTSAAKKEVKAVVDPLLDPPGPSRAQRALKFVSEFAAPFAAGTTGIAIGALLVKTLLASTGFGLIPVALMGAVGGAVSGGVMAGLVHGIVLGVQKAYQAINSSSSLPKMPKARLSVLH